MKRLRDDPSRIVILGGGRGGEAMLEMLHDEPLASVVGIVDHNADSQGILRAKSLGITVFNDVEEALHTCAPCVAFNLTGNEMVEEIAYGILGAGGVIGGLEARLIWRMVTDLKETKKDLEYQATHDPLTGLYNRRFVMEQMHRELDQAQRYGLVCSLILIDLDFFKRVNDVHGHGIGDCVLKQVASGLQKSIRTVDVLGRWGGEEFIVLLPHTNAVDAQQAANKWLQDVLAAPVVLANGEPLVISFSAGVAEFAADAEKNIDQHIESLLEQVDKYLYVAKENGRACVVGATCES